MKLTSIYETVKRELYLVEKELKRTLPPALNALSDPVAQLLNSGGKRLRPALLLLSSKACGYAGKMSINFAAAVELVHTATLVHDDLLDNAHLRRGTETVNHRWGTRGALLVADHLYLRGLSLLSDLAENHNGTDRRIAQIALQTANRVFEGEVLQLFQSGRQPPSEREYLQMIENKTASFFSACCRIGALLGGSSEEIESALGEYGRNLGLAFQITDDILDLVADESKLGKSTGSDILSGILTLPLIHFLRVAPEREKRALLSEDMDRVEDVVQLIKGYGSIEYAREKVMTFANRAKEELGKLPDSDARDSLRQICDFVVERDR